MTDVEVNLALTQLFSATNPKNEIVEFCHHDYQGLLESGAFTVFEASRKILITSPLSVCKARNRLRPSPVPDRYVERAWQATQSLIARCTTAEGHSCIVIDSSEQPLVVAVEAAVKFMKWNRRAR